jgi:L-fuconate dehydratase
VQHLSIFDYIAVSASLEGRITEYVDHLHEHFVFPVMIRDGRYMPPLDPGYSIEMKPESLDYYEFPNGTAWQNSRTSGHELNDFGRGELVKS